MLDAGSGVPEKVPGLAGIITVAAGASHTLAVKGDGTLWGWGSNESGQLGDNSGMVSRPRPVQIAGVDGVAGVAAGDRHTVVLKKDGTVFAFGGGIMGQLGTGSTGKQAVPTQVVGVTDVAAVACGLRYTVVLKKDGTVWSWGENFQGQLGDGTFEHRSEPVQVKDVRDVIAIAAGEDHTVALKKDGTVWGWGTLFNDGAREIKKSPVPVQMPDLSDVAAIKAGNWHTIALKKDGTVWSWGRNGQNQLGRGTPRFRYLIEAYELNAIASIHAGGFNSFVEKRDGTLLGWGYNEFGQIGDGTKISSLTSAQVAFIAGIDEKGNGNGHAVASAPPPEEPLLAVAAGFEHTVALGRDGTVWTWGKNEEGQLGNRSNPSSTKPQQVFLRGKELLDNVTAVAAGADHSVAVRSDGSVWMWGKSFAYMRYEGNGSSSYAPPKIMPCTKVEGLENVATVEGGSASFIALGKDGAVWTWGSGRAGQDPLRASPVGGLTEVVAVSAGGRHFAALKGDGSVWTWGKNDEGQLGDGTRSSRELPQRVPKLDAVLKVAAGDNFTLVLKSDGTVWGWGANIYGTLPSGLVVKNSLEPVQIAGLSAIIDIAAPGHCYANGAHVLALAQDGTVWSRGFNNFGQLGQGTKAFAVEQKPGQVAGLKQASKLAAGGAHSMALLSDGTLWAWGKNFYGQLGADTRSDSALPVRVVLGKGELIKSR